jgi:hypothetical protein
MTLPEEQMPTSPQEKASEETARQVNDLLDSPEFAMAIETRAVVSVSAKPRAITSRPSMTTSHCHLLLSFGMIRSSKPDTRSVCSTASKSAQRMSSPLIGAPTRGASHHATICASTAFLSRLFVERPQRIHHVIEEDRTLSSGRASQSWNRLDCTRIRGPRGEDRSLLIQRQIGVVDHVGRMLERLCWMQKRIKIPSIIAVVEFLAQEWVLVVHRLSSESFDLNCSWLGLLELRQR